MKNDGLRHEIFGDVLSSHLGLTVGSKKDESIPVFTRGYFLGRHDVSADSLLMTFHITKHLSTAKVRSFGAAET